MKILLVRTFASVMNPASYNSQEIGLAPAFIRAGMRHCVLQRLVPQL